MLFQVCKLEPREYLFLRLYFSHLKKQQQNTCLKVDQTVIDKTPATSINKGFGFGVKHVLLSIRHEKQGRRFSGKHVSPLLFFASLNYLPLWVPQQTFPTSQQGYRYRLKIRFNIRAISPPNPVQVFQFLFCCLFVVSCFT